MISKFEIVTGEKVNIIWGARSYRKREVVKLWDAYENLPNWEIGSSLEEGLRKYILNTST